MNLLFKISIVYFLIAPLAHAYIDPGSGMLYLQGFLALIGILIAFVKSPIQSIKDLYKRIRNKNERPRGSCSFCCQCC